MGQMIKSIAMNHWRLLSALAASLSVHVLILGSPLPSVQSSPPQQTHFIEIGLVEFFETVSSKTDTTNQTAESAPTVPQNNSASPKRQSHSTSHPQSLRHPPLTEVEERPIPKFDMDLDELFVPDSSLAKVQESDQTRDVAMTLMGNSQSEAASVSSLARTTNEPIPLSSGNPSPLYPTFALRRGWEGEVMLKVWVSRNGRVNRVEIVDSSGYSLLDKSAVKAVSRWRFHPAHEGGKEVESIVRIPVHFELRKG